MLQRVQLLKQLEPYPHKTLEEVLNLYEKALINANLVKLKINFTTLVERFERENINIISFGSALPLRDKVKLITEKLLEYVKNEPTTTPKQEP